MEPEQRLRQLTADFPGTAPPSESLASVVQRGRRAALVHRVGTAATAVVVLLGAAVLGPRMVDTPPPPVIGPVLEDPTPSPAPEPTEQPTIEPFLIGALPGRPDPVPTDPATVEPAPATAEPAPAPPVAQPTPKPEPTEKPSEPTTQPSEPTTQPSEPTAEPSEPTRAAYDGFEVTVRTDATAYTVGDDTRILIEACNNATVARTQTHAQSLKWYDLWIRNSDTGEFVADTSSRTYSDQVETVTWEPGQCRSFVEVWAGNRGAIDGGDASGELVAPGRYEAKLRWAGQEGDAPLGYRFSPPFELTSAPGSGLAPFEGFTVQIVSDRTSYALGEEVRLTVTVCNTADQAREQTLPGTGHWYDLYVLDSGGTIVADTNWRSYDGTPQTVSFAAGACRSWTESWWQDTGKIDGQATGEQVPAGTYKAKLQWRGTEDGHSLPKVHSDPFELTG